MSIFSVVDDKYIPLYRVVWISKTPHYCGEEDCQREGYYEVRLEQEESLWANGKERDKMLEAIQAWHDGVPPEENDGNDLGIDGIL